MRRSVTPIQPVSITSFRGEGSAKSEAGKTGKPILPGRVEVKGKGGVTPPMVSFPERVKTGEIKQVTAGAVAKKINLSEQYNMSIQGDVARRMGLNKKGVGPGAAVVRPGNGIFTPHPNYVYRGPVHPTYVAQSFRYGWHLPYFCGGFCWYPRWSPWVDWSWRQHVHPIWDPRPIWCRPVVYIDATPWVYWQAPVWVALPSVPSGTWVDVPPAVVPAQQYDLQMLAVRFVDAGHPEQNLGPSYRVWFRNNSDQPITQPFNVFLLASADGQFRPDSPRAGVRVTAIEAGDTQSVDIRLPLGVTQMAAAADTTFEVLVDANQEINDVDRTNNGAVVRQADILPVDPAVFQIDSTSAPAGGQVTLAGEGLGPEPGKVLIHLAGVEMEAQILGWYDLGVQVTLPALPLAAPTQAELIVVRGDGAAANPVPLTIAPPVAGGPALPPALLTPAAL